MLRGAKKARCMSPGGFVAEWSSPYEGDPPPDIKASVDEVVHFVNRISTSPTSAGAYPIPDRPRVVSILGGRGTGKSTLLQFAVRALAKEPNTVVLPVVDPEAFAPGDSLAGWVLAHLERQLRDRDRAYRTTNEDRSVEQLLEDLRRSQAVRTGPYLPGLQGRGLSFDDFARDAVKIPAHGVRMAEQLAELLNALAAARGHEDLRLVIPVDDADLFPELLPQIVQDAQTLGASPRVVVVFAADRRTLANALQIGYLASHGAGATAALTHGLLEPRSVREAVERKLVKHFPRSLRVELPVLTAEQRLAFVPLGLGTERTLQDLLGRFRLEDGTGRTLADLFTIRTASGAVLAASQYALALSDNVRDIRQLYEALSVIDPDVPAGASDALATVVRHGLDAVEAELPNAVKDVVRIRMAEKPEVRFDFTTIGNGKSVLGGARVYRRPDVGNIAADLAAAAGDVADSTLDGQSDLDEAPMVAAVYIHRLSGHYSVYQSHRSQDDAGAGTEGPEGQETSTEQLPEQFTYLMLLAWEAAQGDENVAILRLEGFASQLALPGGRNWTNTVSGWAADEDWGYWLVPAWDEISKYFIYQDGWNRLVEAILVLGRVQQTVGVLELMLLAHLDLVAGAHVDHVIPDWIVDLHSNIAEILQPSSWPAHRARLQEEVLSNLKRAFEQVSKGQHFSDSDYIRWFSELAPLSASRLLTSRSMSAWFIDHWMDLVPARARQEAAVLLSEYARGHITTQLADGDIELLERVEPPADGHEPSRAATLESVRTQYRARREQRRSELASQLERTGVPEDLIQQLASVGATDDILLRLIQSGQRPEALTAIADAFPAERAIPPTLPTDPPA
jgi:hypothetical protein